MELTFLKRVDVPGLVLAINGHLDVGVLREVDAGLGIHLPQVFCVDLSPDVGGLPKGFLSSMISKSIAIKSIHD